ncbi:ATPase [Boudabousia liubingyangii]|uniref:DUF349 domain-containing protein n=1 Tax=Boudabousia liubingyangii TaxID=1921764 RepID=UPI00093B0EED|nr:DUF349 domain-containing protein [Boudabousia liubingyangii]OKL47715.1 ATPase [Boudabousia liubingyangii]
MSENQIPTPTPEAAEPAKTAETEASVTPTPVALTAAEQSNSQFGRIDADGTVWVRDGESERQIGQYADGVPEDGLELYIRRFLDLEAQVKLFSDRLPNLSPKDIDSTLSSLKQQLEEPAAVGDLPALRQRLENIASQAEQRKEEARAARAAAREQALAERTKIVEAAEALANQDPERTQWKNSGQQLRDLLDQWKQAQKRGPKLERAAEDALWKRFSASRTLFDRQRRQFFSALDARQAEVKATKEKLIAEAEALSTSTDWGATSAAYRGLMDQWKAAGRSSRKDDDALWERFRDAQQKFFDARKAANSAMDEEFTENLKQKEALLEKAEAILPVTDIEAAKAALRPLQDQWDAIGRVPRNDVKRIEGRMRAVEEAIRNAEEEVWRKSNPETKARAEGMLGQLEALIEQIDADIEKAKADGDQKSLAELESARSARVAWLEQIKNNVD